MLLEQNECLEQGFGVLFVDIVRTRFEQLLMLESISPGPGRLVPLPTTTSSLVRATG